MMTSALGRAIRVALSPMLLLAVWEAISRFGGIDPVYLPPPSEVAHSFVTLIASGELWTQIKASLIRVALGYSLAAILGITIGLVLGWWRRISEFIDPLVEIFRPVSPISIIPLAILWFGIGEQSKVFLIVYATFFPILLGTVAGVRGTDPVLIRAARALGASELRLLWTVVIPAAIPFIYNSLRISMGIALIVIISSEMVAADSGVGWFIIDSQRVYRTDQMFVGIIAISAIALVLDQSMKKLRQMTLPWWQDTTA